MRAVACADNLQQSSVLDAKVVAHWALVVDSLDGAGRGAAESTLRCGVGDAAGRHDHDIVGCAVGRSLDVVERAVVVVE